ncbi:NAD-dependent epimerase/dehydratase family protein [Pseudochelatococcus sp. B33]
MTRGIEGKRMLVTGGASLVGSHLADALLAAGASEVILFDNFSLGTPQTIAHLVNDPRVQMITGDVLKPDEIREAAEGVSGVFALAGFLTLPMSQTPLTGVAVNCTGMANTLEASRMAGVDRVVFSSSTAVYGNSNPDRMIEPTPYLSAGLSSASMVYSSSKLVGEGLCSLYQEKYGLEFNALRFSTVYGERQHLRAVNAAFMAKTYEAIRNGEPPIIHGDGSEVHDYIYVTDVANACVAAYTSEKFGLAMNISTGIDVSLNELVLVILELAGRTDLRPQYVQDTREVRSSSVAHLRNSSDLARNQIGWKPKVSLREGIKRLIDWREAQAIGA